MFRTASLTVSIIDINTNEVIHFYPNPTGNVLTIESNAAFNKIKVYDILGKLVETAQFQDSKSYLLDVKNYLNGIYFIQVNNNPLERIIVSH